MSRKIDPSKILQGKLGELERITGVPTQTVLRKAAETMEKIPEESADLPIPRRTLH